jgi:hypothetical protein
MSVYQELESLCLPLITHWREDLTKHDREGIEQEHPGVPFLHWTRDTGTNISFLIPWDAYPKLGEVVPFLFGVADREHLLNEVVGFAEWHAKGINDPKRFTVHYFDGKKLKQITVQKAVQIAKEYAAGIQRLWNVEKNVLSYRE